MSIMLFNILRVINIKKETFLTFVRLDLVN
jgi:hypothetical protein